jgi:hypothetical protein
MPLEALDTAAVARALALVTGRPDEAADVYYERRLDAELPPAGVSPGLRVRREEGLAARLVRGERSWLAARDGLAPPELAEALRAVARALPPALPEPERATAGSPLAPPVDALLAFPGRLERALRRRLVAFPVELVVRWHEREVRVVTPQAVSPVERERFASLAAATPWGRSGLLAPALDDVAAEALAERLALRFRARDARPPGAGHPPLLLAPAAAAVAFHEGVAHALEADLLARSGSPEAIEGVELGAAALDVLDDPQAAPAGVARRVDDEGIPTLRRWLVRQGRGAQPIADARAARRWSALLPGSGFRADRHSPPLPRTLHLEILPGDADEARLRELAKGGLYIQEIESGRLDLATGELHLAVAAARRLHAGEAQEPVGAFRIRGRVTDLLGGVLAIGAERAAAGAGWCAKGGQRRAVWATLPALVVAGLAVLPEAG